MRPVLSAALGAALVVGVLATAPGPASAAPNHRPGRVQISAASVPEDATPGTVVGHLSAPDKDARARHRFTLVGGEGSDDNGLFRITKGDLVLAGTLDFETDPSLTVRVRVTDERGARRGTAIAISVLDRAEPRAVALAGSSVAENQPGGTVVGALSTTGGSPGESFDYTVVSGAFRAVGDQLVTGARFDYEASKTEDVRVRSTDAAGRAVIGDFTITITDVDDPRPPVVVPNRAPYNLTPSSVSVAENLPSGTLVATASAVDPDGDTLTYSLVSGGGSCRLLAGDVARSCRRPASYFDVAPNGAITTDDPLDYELGDSYTIVVRATDPGGLSTDGEVTIDVTDVNDAPWDIQLTSIVAVTDDTGWWSTGRLSASDEDAGDVISFSVVSAVDSHGDPVNAAYFDIGLCGGPKLAADTDALTVGSYLVTVRATDLGGLTYDEAFPVTVVPPPDPSRVVPGGVALRRC